MSTHEFIKGAKACLDALQRMRPMVEGDHTQTTAQYFERRDAAVAMIIETAGPVSARAAGVITLMAEYFVDDAQTSQLCELDEAWFQAILTPKQREIQRKEFADGVAGANDEPTSNVIHLFDRTHGRKAVQSTR